MTMVLGGLVWDKMGGMPDWLLDLEMESGEPSEVVKKASRGKG